MHVEQGLSRIRVIYIKLGEKKYFVVYVWVMVRKLPYKVCIYDKKNKNVYIDITPSRIS